MGDAAWFKFKLTPGNSRATSCAATATLAALMLGARPMLNRYPLTEDSCRPGDVASSAACSRMFRCGRTSRPSAVRRTFSPVWPTRGPPSSTSSFSMARENRDNATSQRPAARSKFSVLHRVKKNRIWVNSKYDFHFLMKILKLWRARARRPVCLMHSWKCRTQAGAAIRKDRLAGHEPGHAGREKRNDRGWFEIETGDAISSLTRNHGRFWDGISARRPHP